MLFNNRMRPAFATAGAPQNGFASRKSRNDALMFDANTEADDFGAFTSDQTRERAQRRERPAPSANKPPKKGGIGRTGIIVIAAVVAVVLLCVVIGAVILNSSKNITYTNNTYLVYTEGSSCRVIVNGTVLDKVFEGDTRVVPSLDHSFAYIECNSTNGYQIDIVKGKKLTSISDEDSAITEILGYAETEPGVIYREKDKVYIYNDTVGIDVVESNPKADNFLLSGDASTVVYTRPSATDTEKARVYLYRDGSAAPIDGVNNCTPVMLSDDGKYLYGYGYTTTQPRKLYCITTEDGEKYPVCESNFGGITAMNIAGNEILYYTVSDTKVTSWIYSFKKETSIEIAKGKGAFYPVTDELGIARYSTFADSYLQSTNLDISALLDADESTAINYTFYLNKKLESKQVANAIGQFSPDGKYFYYLKPTSKYLYQVDLSDLTKDPKKLFDIDIVQEFAVTQKGNLYILDNGGDLWFRKPSNTKNDRVVSDVGDISMHQYANQLYFTNVYEDEEEANVYITKEGSKKEVAMFSNTELPALPAFTAGNQKKSFAYFYTVEGDCSVYYTANGKSFKKMEIDCQEIVTDGASSWLPDWSKPSNGGNQTNNNTTDNNTDDSTLAG